MNTSITEKKPTERSTSFLSRLVPTGAVARTLYWAILPFSLLLLSVGVSFLNPSPLTTTLPFLSFVGAIACWKFRTRGLITTYVSLAALLLMHYNQIPAEDRLWQMGILFTLAIEFFVILLAAEEIEEHIGGNCTQTHEVQKLLHQAELTYTHAEQQWHDQRQHLEKEIQELKKEVELRHIERQKVQKRFELVESEIGLLTSQKNQFIEDARSAYVALAEYKTQYEKLASDKMPLVQKNAEFQDLEMTLQAVCRERDSWQKEADELKARLKALPKPSVVSDEEVLEWKRAKAKAEGLYNQLRIQFAEKSEALHQARRERFELQEKLEGITHDQQLAEHDAPPEQVIALERTIVDLTSQVMDLESEVCALESLITALLEG